MTSLYLRCPLSTTLLCVLSTNCKLNILQHPCLVNLHRGYHFDLLSAALIRRPYKLLSRKSYRYKSLSVILRKKISLLDPMQVWIKAETSSWAKYRSNIHKEIRDANEKRVLAWLAARFIGTSQHPAAKKTADMNDLKSNQYDLSKGLPLGPHQANKNMRGPQIHLRSRIK